MCFHRRRSRGVNLCIPPACVPINGLRFFAQGRELVRVTLCPGLDESIILLLFHVKQGNRPVSRAAEPALARTPHLTLSEPNHARCADRRVRLVLQVVPTEGWDVRAFHVKPEN